MAGKERDFRLSILKAASLVMFHTLAAGIDAEGTEKLPQTGPAIIAFNHMAWAEAFVPLLYLNELPVTVTKAENFEAPGLGWLVSHLDAIGVRRGEADRQALAASVAALTKGRVLYFAPEGTRGRERDGNRRELKVGKSGVIFIASKAARELGRPIDITPVAVWGGTETIFPEMDDHNATPAQRFGWQRQRVFLRVGDPVSVGEAKLTNEDRQTLTDRVMLAIRDMLPRQYHGAYAHF